MRMESVKRNSHFPKIIAVTDGVQPFSIDVVQERKPETHAMRGPTDRRNVDARALYGEEFLQSHVLQWRK